tara:strand:- start:123 stop:380 length:258 start_codon:yes stop_codon:yes gene_type:complete
MDDKSLFKMIRSSKFLANKVRLLATHKPHVICEVLTSIQLKLLVAEKRIRRSESTSVDASITALNRSIALLQQCENRERPIKKEN